MFVIVVALSFANKKSQAFGDMYHIIIFAKNDRFKGNEI